MIIALVIIVILVLAPIGAFTLIVANSRASPFPVAWARGLAGQSDAQLVHGDGFFSLSLLSYTRQYCTFQVEALGLANGSILWLSKPFNLTNLFTPCYGRELPSMHYISGMIYLLAPSFGYSVLLSNGTLSTGSFDVTRLAVIGMSPQTGQVLSIGTAFAPNGIGFLGSGFLGTNGNDVYAGYLSPGPGMGNSSQLDLEGFSPARPGTLQWNESLSVPASPLWDMSASLSVGSDRLLVVVTYDSSGPLLITETYYLINLDPTDGSVNYRGFLPRNESELSGGSALAIGATSGTVYYTSGYDLNGRLLGVNGTDGAILMNASIPTASNIGGELSVVNGQVFYGYPEGCAGPGCYTGPTGYLVYSASGNLQWSISLDTGTSMALWSPMAFSNGLVLLINLKSAFVSLPGTEGQLDYGGLYGAYYLVNSTNGRVVWFAGYSPIVLPPWTPAGPAPEYVPLISAGHYVLFSVSSAGNTTECVDIHQLG